MTTESEGRMTPKALTSLCETLTAAGIVLPCNTDWESVLLPAVLGVLRHGKLSPGKLVEFLDEARKQLSKEEEQAHEASKGEGVTAGEDMAMDVETSGDMIAASTVTANPVVQVRIARPKDQLESALASVLWVATLDKEGSSVDENLAKLMSGLLMKKIISLEMLQTSLELPSLVSAGLLGDSKGTMNRMVKVHTGMAYKQQKYNILREETQGYSRLVLVLLAMPSYNPSDSTSETPVAVEEVVSSVMSVIGQFDLDPNRTVDVILAAMESQPTNLYFLPLLRKFGANLVHILGVRLLQAATLCKKLTTPEVANAGKEGDELTTSAVSTSGDLQSGLQSPSPEVSSVNAQPLVANSSVRDSKSTILVCAVLIMSGLVKLSQLSPYMSHTLAETAAEIIEMDAATRKEWKSLDILLRNSTKTDVTLRLKHVAANLVPHDLAMKRGGISRIVPIIPESNSAASQATVTNTDINARTSIVLANGQVAAGSARVPSITASGILPSAPEVTDNEARLAACNFFQSFNSTQSHTLSQKETIELARTNQWVALLAALVKVRGWGLALELILQLEKLGASRDALLTTSAVFRRAVSELFSWSIDDISKSAPIGATNGGNSAVPYQHLDFGGAESLAVRPIPSFRSKSEPSLPICGDMNEIIQLTAAKTLDVGILRVQELVQMLGPFVSEDSPTYVKICRFLTLYLETYASEIIYTPPLSKTSAGDFSTETKSEATPLSAERVQTLMSILLALLYGLSVSGTMSTFLSTEVWRVIGSLHFTQRYALYEAWRSGKWSLDDSSAPVTNRPWLVQVTEAHVTVGVRRELQLLAKENLRTVSRSLAKFTHGNPTLVLSAVIRQVVQFDNLIPLAVEALRQATPLTRDVYSACLLRSLRTEESLQPGSAAYGSGDGLSYPMRFTFLARFIAAMYGRQPTMEMRGLLHWLVATLSDGTAIAALVLKELIVAMGGSVSLAEASNAELEGAAGGVTLRNEAVAVSNEAKSSRAVRAALSRATTALRETLFNCENRLGVVLLSVMSALSSSVLFGDRDQTQRTVAWQWDVLNDVRTQFADFLSGGAAGGDAVAISRLAETLRSLETVCEEMPLVVACNVARPIIRCSIRASVAEKTAKEAGEVSENTCFAGVEKSLLSLWHPLSPNFLQVIRTKEQTGSEDLVSEELRALFWCLGLSDIHLPAERYTTEITRTKNRYTKLGTELNLAVLTQQSSKGIALTAATKKVKNLDEELKHTAAIMNALTEERQNQDRHVEAVKALVKEVAKTSLVEQQYSKLLSNIKDTLREDLREAVQKTQEAISAAAAPTKPDLPNVSENDTATSVEGEVPMEIETSASTPPITAAAVAAAAAQKWHPTANGNQIRRTAAGLWHSRCDVSTETIAHTSDAILRLFVAPRLLTSPLDALYAIRFVRLLSSGGLPGACPLDLSSRLIDCLSALLWAATETESVCIGLAIAEVLTPLVSWFSDNKKMRSECVPFAILGASISVQWTLPADGSAPSLNETTPEGIPIGITETVERFVPNLRFEALISDCHTRLTDTLIALLNSTEYAAIRAALVAMSRFASVFPYRADDGDRLLAALEARRAAEENSSRVDILTLTRSVLTHITRRRPEWFTVHTRSGRLSKVLYSEVLAKQAKEATINVSSSVPAAYDDGDAGDLTVDDSNMAVEPGVSGTTLSEGQIMEDGEAIPSPTPVLPKSNEGSPLPTPINETTILDGSVSAPTESNVRKRKASSANLTTATGSSVPASKQQQPSDSNQIGEAARKRGRSRSPTGRAGGSGVIHRDSTSASSAPPTSVGNGKVFGSGGGAGNWSRDERRVGNQTSRNDSRDTRGVSRDIHSRGESRADSRNRAPQQPQRGNPVRGGRSDSRDNRLTSNVDGRGGVRAVQDNYRSGSSTHHDSRASTSVSHNSGRGAGNAPYDGGRAGGSAPYDGNRGGGSSHDGRGGAAVSHGTGRGGGNVPSDGARSGGHASHDGGRAAGNISQGSGRGGNAPHDGRGGNAPHDGRGGNAPHDGRGGNAPHDGRGGNAPHDGRGGNAPHDGRSRNEPHDGRGGRSGEGNYRGVDNARGNIPHDSSRNVRGGADNSRGAVPQDGGRGSNENSGRGGRGGGGNTGNSDPPRNVNTGSDNRNQGRGGGSASNSEPTRGANAGNDSRNQGRVGGNARGGGNENRRR